MQSAALIAAFALTPNAYAQSYPSKIIRILTTEAGSGTDLVARLIAQGYAATPGQQAVVENRGILAVEAAAKAAPDGHTLLVYSSSMWILPFLRDNPTWDAEKDFAPITQLYRQPNVIVINPALPVNNARELIALAKAKPGELNYGSASAGSPAHLSAELFNAMAGVKIIRVPYKGIGPAITALIGGQIQIIFAIYTSASPHLLSGRLKAIAVTSAEHARTGRANAGRLRPAGLRINCAGRPLRAGENARRTRHTDQSRSRQGTQCAEKPGAPRQFRCRECDQHAG